MERLRSTTTVRRALAGVPLVLWQLGNVSARAGVHSCQWADGLRQTTEDAVLNANYILCKSLRTRFELPYKDTVTARGCVLRISDRRRTREDRRHGQAADRLWLPRLIRFRFQMVVQGAMMMSRRRAMSRGRAGSAD